MIQKKLLLPLAFVGLILGSTTQNAIAQAASVYERVFKTGTMDRLDAGQTVRYLMVTNDPIRKIEDQKQDLVLEVQPEDKLVIQLKQQNKQSRLGTYPKSIGNPVHMFFMEKLIEAMAADTGGSPFYIRNRLKDALGNAKPIEGKCLSHDGKILAGECIVIKPFEHDKARDKMGQFADIQLFFSVDDDNPAYIVGLHATNPEKPDGFSFGLDLES